MSAAPIDSLPGFRRRFTVTPEPGAVTSALEDDYHCMAVTIRHDDGVATGIEPIMERAPWTTCPGAVEQLRRTFTGLALDAFPGRGDDKVTNCTHLYDLALLAAAHARDAGPTRYDVLTSDPVDGIVRTELRRNDRTVMDWTIESWTFTAPAELAGVRLDKMGRWIETLDPEMREAARILRWGTMIAHGRSTPLEDQSDATRMPPNCHTFQPHNAALAQRVGVIREFSRGGLQPLERPDGLFPGHGEKTALPSAGDAA